MSSRNRISRAVLAGLAFAVVVAAVVGLMGAGSQPYRAPAGFERPSRRASLGPESGDPLARSSSVALGVSLPAPSPPLIRSFAKLAEQRPQLVMWYQEWSEPFFYPEQLAVVSALGAFPMISWDPVSNGSGIPLSQIAEGRWDRYIKVSALAAASWRKPIYVRFAHEMNLPGSPFGPGHSGNTPLEFVRAWRHVVTVFRQEGAWNVKWIFSPNVDCLGHCPFTAFFPGTAWTDWLALDGYNYGGVDGDAWLGFRQLFGPSYRLLARLSVKPMMIGETSSSDQGGSKTRWILGMGQALARDFTRIRALVWFQRIKETDWRINSASQALAAFRTVVRSPLFMAGGHRRAQRGRLS